MNLDDKSWTKIPVLHMAGRVMPEEGKATPFDDSFSY